MEKLGVVTVLYRSEEVLEDFFLSLKMQTYKNCCVYLIDNAPSAKTREIINKWKPCVGMELKHIENEENYGAAGGNNIGIKNSIAEGCQGIIMLNNDIYFDNPDLFKSLVTMASSAQLPIIAPKIYYYQTKKIWFAGGDIINWQAGVKHYGDKQNEDDTVYKTGYTGYAPTTFVYMSSEVFKKTGLLDEKYFIYAEDVDLMYRAKLAGYKIWYEASLNLQHKVSITTGGILSATGFYYNTRNRVYFARKFYPVLLRGVAILYVFVSLGYHCIKQKNSKSKKAFLNGFFKGFKLRRQTEMLLSNAL